MSVLNLDVGGLRRPELGYLCLGGRWRGQSIAEASYEGPIEKSSSQPICLFCLRPDIRPITCMSTNTKYPQFNVEVTWLQSYHSFSPLEETFTKNLHLTQGRYPPEVPISNPAARIVRAPSGANHIVTKD